MKPKCVLIFSGGVDSTTLLYDLISQGYEVHALSFNYGQRHDIELAQAKLICAKLKVYHKIVPLHALNHVAPSALTREDIEVPDSSYDKESMKATVVPNRNMVMIALATSYAIGIGAKEVAYGAHKGDSGGYPDCRIGFIEAIRKVLEVCDWEKIKLHAPYALMTKGQIVRLGTTLGVDYSLTWSCYNGKDLHCGKCGTCKDRLSAFKEAGIEDPVEYENDRT